MTIQVQQVTNTSSFSFWVNRTNDLANAISNYAVTTQSNTAVGNAAITGTFTANSINVNTFLVNTSILVGNSLVNSVINSTSLFVGTTTSNVIINATSVALANSTANISLTIPTAAQISNGQYYFSSNGSWNLVSGISNKINTSGLSTQTIDSFSSASYKAAEYLISVKDNLANNYYSSKLLLMHDGGNAYITEYAMLISNTTIGVFSATLVSSNVNLQLTPVSSNTTVTFTKVIF
jgi:hypothetical protein